MKVVILCGGLGTRLREETEFRPKPMVNIGNRPVLWHVMKIYEHYGFNEFILALGYKGEMIKDYFLHYEIMNNDFTIELGKTDKITIHHSQNEVDWKVTLVDTGEKTLKGGRLKRIEKYIDSDTFMMTYGDGVGNVPIPELLSFHQQHGKIATVTGIHPTSQFGELKLSGDRVESFHEKPDEKKSIVSGGFFVFNHKIFDYVTADEHCDFEFGPLEQIAKEGQLVVYRHQGFWACMDTYRDTEHLNKLWDNNDARWKIW